MNDGHTRGFWYLIQIAVLFFLYFFSARIGLDLQAVNKFAALIWPASGIALAALILFGYRLWPGIALGAFLVNFLNGANPFIALGIALGNTLEAMAGKYLLERFIQFNTSFGRVRASLAFIVLCSFFASMLSATIGVFSLVIGGIISFADFSSTWTAWWVGDMLGILVISPLLLRWATLERKVPTVARVIESGILILLLGTINLLIFWSPFVENENALLAYLIFIPLIWSALRFGPRGTSTAIFITAAIAISSTLLGHGPFATSQIEDGLLLLQIFIGSSAIVFLLLASAVKERRTALEALEDHVERLEHALQKISSADQAKNDFLAILAHELRNPLAPVVSSLEFMKRMGKDHPDFENSLHTIEKQIHTITLLLDDLLDVSRISRKKFKLQKETVDLRTIISQSIATVDPLVKAKNHALTLSTPSTPIWISGDPLRLEQIIVNLLTNAIKYTDAGGFISITLTTEGAEVIVSVEDDGIGIDQHMIQKIFEPFLQAENRSQRSAGGLGIGLSLTKKLVEMHGGEITAKSEGRGKGSEFIITLPIPEKVQLPITLPGASAEPHQQEERRNGGREENTLQKKFKILIVDDNEIAAKGLGILLEHSGHAIRLAHEGNLAIQIALDFNPHVVVLDIGLPDIDGYEVAARLREKYGESITIIALTGYGQEEDKLKSKQTGFNHHLTKPISVEEIEKILVHKH